MHSMGNLHTNVFYGTWKTGSYAYYTVDNYILVKSEDNTKKLTCEG